MYNRLHTIPACDVQTDRQTSCHGTVRAMHTPRAVKTKLTTLTILNHWLRHKRTTSGIV